MTLRGRTPVSSYSELLQLPSGLAATPAAIEDGVGQATALQLSLAGLNLPTGSAEFSYPPTDAQLTALFGSPATRGAGFVGIAFDSTDPLASWLVWTTAAGWWHVMALGIPAYQFYASLNAPDQALSDDQVLTSVLQGVEIGSVTIVADQGELAISGGLCAFAGPDTENAVWGGCGLIGSAVTRAAGIVLLARVTMNDLQARLLLLGAASLAEADQRAELYLYDRELSVRTWNTGGALQDDSSEQSFPLYTEDVELSLAIVIGGYDDIGIGYRASQPLASYPYGSAYFIKGGSYSAWTLLWKAQTLLPETIYPAFSIFNADGSLKDWRVTTTPRKSLLLPTHLSSFSANDALPLEDYLPDAGENWHVDAGAFAIQTARAASTGISYATVETNESDVFIECVINGGASGSGAVLLRLSYYTDTTDPSSYWMVQLAIPDDELQLWEINAGSPTKVDSTLRTLNPNTDYRVRIRCSGSRISVWLDDSYATLSYGSATLNQTATRHGIMGETGATFDNFGVYALTSPVYTAELDNLLADHVHIDLLRITEDGAPRVTEDGQALRPEGD